MTDSSSILLGLNIDHCATVRQARYRDLERTCGGMVEPDPIALAFAAERAGVDGITVHLREDRRHIQPDDVQRLRACLQTRLNLEMAATEAMVAFALEIRPDCVCLVPENRREVSTEGGLDIVAQSDRIAEVVAGMKKGDIAASLFIDPDPTQIEMAAEVGSPVIELHTGSFANAYYNLELRARELERLWHGAIQAHDLGLVVNAGHGINYVNIADVRLIPWLHELNIGHSIISRSLFTGIGEAVQEMKSLMNFRSG